MNYSVDAVKIAYDDMLELSDADGTLTQVYQPILPLTPANATYTFYKPVRMLKIVNQTDATVFFSKYGLDDSPGADVFPPGTGCIYDYGSNKSDQGGVLDVNAGLRLYAKSSKVPIGNFYIVIFYAQAD